MENTVKIKSKAAENQAFNKAIEQAVSALSGREVTSEDGNILVAMSTKDGMVVLMGGDANQNILHALTAILQVYQTQIKPDTIEWQEFCASIAAALYELRGALEDTPTSNIPTPQASRFS